MNIKIMLMLICLCLVLYIVADTSTAIYLGYDITKNIIILGIEAITYFFICSNLLSEIEDYRNKKKVK